MTSFIIFFIIALVAFAIALFMKLGDKRYAYQKAKYLDIFIQQKNITVSHLFIGSYFDLICDAETRTIWFLHLQKRTLQFKEMPYAQIHQVKWEIDGTLIRSRTSRQPLKRDLLTNKVERVVDVAAEVHDQYRVKESILSITLDELEPAVFDLMFLDSRRPIHFAQVKTSDIAHWYDLFVSIIEQNDQIADRDVQS